jgi:hypothetical protein
MIFAQKPGDDPLGKFDLGIIRVHTKSPSA